MRGLPPAIVLVLVAFLLLLSIAPMSIASTAGGLQWLQVKGSLIVREDGTAVILRGVNLPTLYYSRSALVTYSLFLDAAKSMSFNVVRLPILWSELEPSSGTFNTPYLDLVRAIVNVAEEKGMYVALDMHQYKVAEIFGGEGFPSWVVERFRSSDEASVGFWSDLSLQRELADVWVRVASSLRDAKAVFGYDLFNEPLAGLIPWNRFATIVDDFHSYLISMIRVADARHIIIVEPTDVCACTSIFGNQIPLKPQGTNLIFSPHVYVRGSEKDLEYYTTRLHNLTVNTWKIPVWIGEFGGDDIEIEDQNSMNRLNTTLYLFARHGLGWAYWSLQQTGNGPQLVDAHGRTSLSLVDMIRRGAALLLHQAVSNGDYMLGRRDGDRSEELSVKQPVYTNPSLIGIFFLGSVIPATFAWLSLLYRRALHWRAMLEDQAV